MANRLKEMRYKKMLTMTELARRSGITRVTIWRIENDQAKNVTAATMEALAKALDMPVTKIFFTNGG